MISEAMCVFCHHQFMKLIIKKNFPFGISPSFVKLINIDIAFDNVLTLILIEMLYVIFRII